MIVFENFLDDFESFNTYVRQLKYDGAVNPRDGVTYPDISTDIPPELEERVRQKLSRAMGRHLDVATTFLRLTCTGTTTAPHQAHNDEVMGDYTFLLYMQGGPGGTDLVQHIATGDLLGDYAEACMRDTNDYDAWKVRASIKMKKNRAVIFNSRLLHRAEPVEGFGDGAENGRIVLTLFLNRGMKHGRD